MRIFGNIRFTLYFAPFMRSSNISIKNQTFNLLSKKAMYWVEHEALLLSDLHLGKATHFRKSGIQAPAGLGNKDLAVLRDLLVLTSAKNVFIIGDLFHSDLNSEWYLFEDFIKEHVHIKFILIRGNHDSLPAYLLKGANLKTLLQYKRDDILLHHKPIKRKDVYVISGHIHPGIVLRGKGRQSLRLPCFYFGCDYAILPAFGNFTGLATIEPMEGDQVFAIADDEVIELFFD